MAKKVIKKPSIQDILNGGKSLSNDISNYNRYEPNISTQVNNVVRKKYNTNRDKLEEHKTKIGGYYANTTRGKIGTALSAVPFAVAAIPAMGALGEAAAPTVAKIAGSLGGKLLGAGLTSAGLASGINDVSKGEYHWYTPLDLAPSISMGFKAVKNTNKTIENTKTAVNEIKKYISNPHIGNYYTKPEYNNLSYIRQVKDNAVNDMLKTGKMRSSHVATKNDELYDEANILLGKAEDADLSKLTFYNGISKKPSKLPSLLIKQFEDQMFYTGRPFYGNKRKYNYIIKNPSEITDESKLTNKGLEWIESTHKKHSSDARALAIKQGIDPNKAPGRIVVPLYNGSKNEIPVNEFGPFELYRPVKVGNIDLPFYKRTQFNMKNNRTSYADGGKVPPAAAPVKLQINPTNLPLPFTINKAPMTNGEFKIEMARQRGRKMVSDYKDWLNHADKRIFDAVMKMKNTTEPTVPYIKISTPEQREALESAYNYAKAINSPDLPAWEYGMKTNCLPGATCINTITDKYGRPIASNVDLAKNYKKYGYKKVNMKEMEPGDIVQLSMNDTPFHAMMATSTFDPIYKTFSVDQSHGGYDSRTIEHNKKFTTDRDQLDIRSGKIKNDIRALDKSYNYINDNGIQLYRKVWDTPEYRNGGKVTNKQNAKAGHKKNFDDWYKTVPIDRNDTTNYDLRRAYELAPIEELESWRTSSMKDLRNGKNHLRSVYEDPNTGIYHFVKSKNHPTVGLELDWYNSKDGTDFRSKYDLDTSNDYYRYVPKSDYNITLPEVTIIGRKKAYGSDNSYKFGGDVKATPKRKYENNYIMKGTGTYVPKTPQEKIVVDLYNANYKSARKNMPREDALRQAHYRTTQQMMESGYGTSKQARKQNNFGGMGGSNSYKYNTIKDFTDHVDSTMLKNFKDSYKAPTLNKYINGLYNGRIGAYSETPIEVYSKEMRGTHPRTSKIIEQLNPDDYSLNQLNINPYYNEMLNPYVNYNRDIAKFGGCKRPKAFWGAVIGAGLSIASNLINKNAEKKAAKRQAAAEQLEQNRNVAGDITTQLNQQADNSDPYYAQFRTEFAKGGKVKGRKAVITDGGVAIPISKNMSLLRGSTHDEINESGNTGIGINFGGNQVEAQNGEIVRKKNGKLYIYSDEPMQNGISPAERVLNGENPDKVYNSQENYKRNHNIKTNKKYVNGGVAGWLNKNFQGHQFTNGSLVNAGVNLLGQGINFLINKNATNKLKYSPAPIQAQAAKLNTTYNVSPQIANLERNRMRTNEDITRNTSSSVAALNRRNYANLVANDQLNSIYNTKNEAEHKMINEDKMNEQNVRNNNIQQYNAWNAQRTEFENSKKLAKAQNYSNLVNGAANTVSSTINEARKAYLDDQNLKVAAAPYGDGVIADLARNGVHADSLYVDRLKKLGKPKTPYDEALRTLYINSIQDPRLRYEFENDPEFAIPTPGNEDYTIGRLNNINLGNINPIEQSMINNNNYLQSKFDNDWWTRMGKRQFRFPILNSYNNKSFIKVPYRA